MGMNLRRKREEAGLTQAKLAEILGLTQSQISRYEDDPENIPAGLLKRWASALGTSLGELETELEEPARGLDLGDPWAPIRGRLSLLQDFCTSEDAAKATVAGLPGITELRATLSQLSRKVNVVLAGRYDAGKSRLLNTLMGQPVLPTKRQPATRIVTHVWHTDDQPEWARQKRAEVWILGPGFEPADFSDWEKTQQRIITSGNLETLREYGTHGGRHESVREAQAAVVFSDAPILKACNFVDLPGFRGDQSDADADGDRAKRAFSLVDILIYASNATGFLDGVDFAYLSYLLKSLPPHERVDASFPVLGNAFIVATHAYRNISDRELQEDVLNVAAARLYRHFEGSVLAARSEIVDRRITDEDVRGRFFGFLAESKPRRQPFEAELARLLSDRVPLMQRKTLSGQLSHFKAEGTKQVGAQIELCERMLADVDRARQQYGQLLEKEAARKRATQAKRVEIGRLIETLSAEASGHVEKLYASIVSAENVEEIIRQHYGTRQEEAKKFASSFVLEVLQTKMAEKTSELARRLDPFVSEFVRSYEAGGMTIAPKRGAEADALEIPFDAQGAFVGGLGAAGALGALGIWAASLGNLGGYIIAAKAVSLLAALGISIPGGSAAAMAFLASIGGPVTIAVGVFAAVGLLFWKVFGESWERRLARKVVETFHKRALLPKMSAGIAEYWRQTLEAFDAGAANMEREYEANLNRFKALLEKPESSRQELEVRVAQLKDLASFFDRIPTLPP